MRLEPNSLRRSDEERRYFPDWTDRLVEICEELEADHNSYLAGGYAEEFGYRARPGSSRGVPVLDGQPPEDSAEWRSQAAITHPGYPIKPRPIAADGEEAGSDVTEEHRIVCSRAEPLDVAVEVGRRGTFVRVTDRPYQHRRHLPGQRVAAALTRFLATMAKLQWELPHRRR